MRRFRMSDLKQESLRLPGRYYQMFPPERPAGLVHDILELPVSQTCFIALHCWNSGFPDGPQLPVHRFSINTGSPQGVPDGADEQRRRIIENRIAPAIAVAREVGLPIVHVESRRVGSRYAQSRCMLESSEQESPVYAEPIPGWREEQAQQVAGFGASFWEGWSDLDVASPVRPWKEDYVAITGPQLDRILRHLGIINLIYTGFHVGTCVTNSPGGMREMSLHFGYRAVLLRECTLNLECPDTLPGHDMTRAAIRYIEQHVGYTARWHDFMATCRTVVEARKPTKVQLFPHEVTHVDSY
jgi:nicotinamidase-related amidase